MQGQEDHSFYLQAEEGREEKDGSQTALYKGWDRYSNDGVMTEVDFYTAKNGDLLGFHVYGHSGYAEAGEDIVCAAISSAVYMVINTITDIMHIDADVEVEDGDTPEVLQKRVMVNAEWIILPQAVEKVCHAALGLKGK